MTTQQATAIHDKAEELGLHPERVASLLQVIADTIRESPEAMQIICQNNPDEIQKLIKVAMRVYFIEVRKFAMEILKQDTERSKLFKQSLFEQTYKKLSKVENPQGARSK